MPHCLLVDDDAELRGLAAGYLQRFGITSEQAADGAAMRRALARRTQAIDAVLLDLMLPDESGLELCRWLRATEPRLPVIMLTAQGDPISRVVGLEVGADDYIAKPFEPRELVARIHAVLRRTGTPSGGASELATQVVFDGWRLDRLERHLVSPAGLAIALSSAEFRLLCAFIDHAGQVLTRERLLLLTRASGVETTERSIDLAVSRLRAKLEGSGGKGSSPIRTVRGEGYQFDARMSAP